MKRPPATRWLVSTVALLLAVTFGACGGEDEPTDNAVEAREGNVVAFGGIRYRVVLFRQLNRRIVPDRVLYNGPSLEPGKALYAAFLQACNTSAEEQTPTADIYVEDAFGEQFEPLAEVEKTFAYRPKPLQSGQCLPGEDTAADRTFPGAALLFGIDFDDVRERPLILVLRSASEGEPEVFRIQLDV